ncbi:NHL repeat-containing protein [Nitrososphaera viennensis EN76]|uniref:NHL repeat-containing protein n=2 Tax=Nitrososphaera viennensis TaxID=1034015 RepID=A0A060HLX9_9ARCH|nr:NHL repeat-containing protein [Nitrososphaera viennensis EN76]
MAGNAGSSSNYKAQEFPEGFAWLNAEKPLSMAGLKGHVVVLDFWTYCCINCMHTLPTLDWLEKKYRGQPVVFIGVHSAKFFNEQQAQNVQEAIGRYEIGHPVVVDQEMKIWRSYGVTAWPTIVIVDPKCNVVYQQAGEGQRDELDDVIGVLLERHRAAGTLAKEPIEIGHPKQAQKRVLSYPGKLAFSPDGRMLAISDSNHNRVLVVDIESGNLVHKVGGTARDLRDGSFEEARFFRPQGLAWAGDRIIYVADTENHALREIDISAKTVRTLAGDGRQGAWISGAQDGKMTQLSSPWDLAYSDGFLFIAMAGLHQIWAYHIESGKIGPFAGSGYENIVDGSFSEAQFAQPSGLSIYGNFLLVADSEVSAVRLLDFSKKTVQTVVGEGLFEFGFKDGPLAWARLQHPLGVHCAGNKIYVADTYNHAVRLIDLDTQQVSTVVGRAAADKAMMMCRIDDPACDTLGLFEPSDVKQKGNTLYIADTNNHLVRMFDLDKMVLKTLAIKE